MNELVRKLKRIDFSDNFFQASGKGRVRLRNAMRLALGLERLDKLPSDDREEYKRLAG